jgi:outer membrane protein OmpA-like peptidoglycan-associated protein
MTLLRLYHRVLVLLFVPVIAIACAKPLFVSHLSPEGIALTKKKGYGMPTHNYFSRFICFDNKCLKKAAYIKKQRSHRFKGYKDGGKPPRSKPFRDIPVTDSVYVVRQETTSRQTVSPPLIVQADSVIVLNEVLFETDRYQLKPAIYPKLDSLVSFMESKPTLEIIISGHTDNTGTEKHNLQLSEHRARAVAEYLLDKGIDSNRIQHNGYGSSKPVMNNDTAAGRFKNRRVEMLIRSKR